MRLLPGLLCLLLSVDVHAQERSGGVVILVAPVGIPKAAQDALHLQSADLTEPLVQALRTARVGDVRAPADVGCVELACALDAARSSGADLLVRGEAGSLGGRLVMTLTLVNVPDTRVVGTATREVPVASLGSGGMGGLVADLFPGSGVSAQPAAPPPARSAPERVVITAGEWKDIAPAVRTAALGRSAEVVDRAGGFKAVTTEELKGVLQREADVQALGLGDSAAVQKVGEALQAPHLVQLELGKTGRTFVLGASLMDTRSAQVVNRSSLVFQEDAQLLDAVDVVTRRLLGRNAVLPPADADPSRLEVRLQALMNDVLAKYRELPQGGAAGLVILPFAESGSEARTRKLGTQLATFMGSLAGNAPGVGLAEKAKIAQLEKQHDLGNPLSLGSQAYSEMGVFLGAQALLVGSVGDLGTDFLLQARLVKVAGGQTLWSGNAMFPRARPGQLLPSKVVVSRSRAEAVTRAVVPGLAQFTAGPVGILKGTLIVGVIGAASAALLGGLVAAVAMGVGAWLWNQEHGTGAEVLPLPPSPVGQDPVYCSSNPAITEKERAGCQTTVMFYGALAAAGAAVGIAGLVTALGMYGLSFVDAAIFGVKAEEVSFESVE